MMQPAILISGAGPVAFSCALWLLRQGVAPARIGLPGLARHAAGTHNPTATEPTHPALARRTLALSHGSCQILERIITLPESGRIETVEVSLAGSAGRTRIHAADLGLAALGQVVTYGALLEKLVQAALKESWAEVPEPLSQPLSRPLAQPPDSPLLQIHAEGDPGPEAQVRDFGQHALLAEVLAPEAPATLGHWAFERFCPGGPVALLPLAEAGRRALVWCDTEASCQARSQSATLAPGALNAELTERFAHRLGPLALDGPVTLAPLVRKARKTRVQGAQVWIGNAAQTLHPVAGQGLNLGLRDAFELARAVAQAERRGEAAASVLAGFGRSRRTDRSLTIALTDLMAASFTWPLARPLQSGVLTLLDGVPGLRRPLAAQLAYGWRC